MSTVSVCVPTYNGAQYLRPCLDSILGQTYRDFELLLVDDCSQDSTAEILAEYAGKDARVKLFLGKHNRGLVGNWNHCVSLARGRWVKFVFQDDLLREDCLAKMLDAANRPIVFCRRRFLFKPGTDEASIRSYTDTPSIPDIFGDVRDIGPIALRDTVLRETANFFGEPTAVLIERGVFDRFGLFNPDLQQICDLEYWIRVAINTGISYVDEPLVTFRCHPDSTSADNQAPLKAERIGFFDRLVMLHEFAYAAHYAILRRHARRISPKRCFSRELGRKSAWVHEHARSLMLRPHCPDPLWRSRLRELEQRYPRLRLATWRLVYSALEFWDRQFGWRFSKP